MKRFTYLAVVLAYGAFGGGAIAQATEIEIDAFEWGATNAPVQSFSFGMRGYHTSPGSPDPKVTDFNVIRQIDLASPDLFQAALNGTLASTVTISACSQDCTAPAEYMKYTMENVVISSYSVGSDRDIPIENVTLNYTKITFNVLPDPAPPRTAWGAIVPQNLPPGGMEPYDFDFVMDAAAIDALFDRPLSDLGDSLPATLLNVSVIPEPGALSLLLTAIAALGTRAKGVSPDYASRLSRAEFSSRTPGIG